MKIPFFWSKKMHEQTLRDYFEGIVSAEDLAHDVDGCEEKKDSIKTVQHISDMQQHYEVRRSALLKLCDDVLLGKISPAILQPIAFAVLASDHFDLDADKDNLVVEVLNDWSVPEVNLPLTLNNIRQCRKWLREEEPYPDSPKAPEGATVEKILSIREKKSFRFEWRQA